jgi:hypothetical protein
MVGETGFDAVARGAGGARCRHLPPKNPSLETNKKRSQAKLELLFELVGETGFEPATPCSQSNFHRFGRKS